MKLAILILFIAVSAAAAQRSSRNRNQDDVKSKSVEAYEIGELNTEQTSEYKRNTKLKDDGSSSSGRRRQTGDSSKAVDGFLRQRVRLQNDRIFRKITNVTRGDEDDNRSDTTDSKSVGGFSRQRLDSLSDSIYNRVTNTSRPRSRGSPATQSIEGFLKQRVKLEDQNLVSQTTNFTRTKPGSTGGSSSSASSTSGNRRDNVNDPLDKLFLSESDFVDVESIRRGGKSESTNKPKSIKEIFYGREQETGWDWTQPQTTGWRWITFENNVAAAGCGFNKRAFKTVQIANQQFGQCGNQCTSDPSCTHFDYDKGNCRMYSGNSKRDDAGNSRDQNLGFCGFSDVKNWNQKGSYTWSDNCNFLGKSEQSVPLRPGQDCGQVCDSMFPSCTHFVANSDSCIIKKGSPSKSDAFTERAGTQNQTKCGIVNNPTSKRSKPKRRP